MKKIENFISENYIKINEIMIYFLLISMSLFLSTKYFPIIEIGLVFVAIYIIYFSILKEMKPILKFIKSPFFIWYMLFWTFVVVITCIRNQVQLLVLIKTIIAFSAYVIGFGIIYNDTETKKNIDIFKIMENIAIFLGIWILVWEHNLLLQGERIGYSVMVGNPNSAASLLSIYVFAVIYKVSKNRKKIDIFALILCVFVIFSTGSKKAIIVVAIASLLLLFKDGKIVKKRILYFGITLGVIILACFTVPALYEYIGRRFLSLFGEIGLIQFHSDHSSELRAEYIEKAIELWKNNLWIGGGYDNFRVNSGFETYSHNNYVELLSSVGILGLTIYYGYYLLLLWKNARQSNLNMKNILYILFIISTLVSDVGSVIFSLYPLYYIMLIIIDNDTALKSKKEEINGI